MLLPIVSMVVLSFWSQQSFTLVREFTLDNYWLVFTPGESREIAGLTLPFEVSSYVLLMVRSVIMAAMATAAVVLLAYPMAYFLAFRVERNKIVWLIVVTIPFWTSYVLRLYAWKLVLGTEGPINSALMALGIVSEPLELLYNQFAVIVVLAHAWAAFAILPIYASLEKIDRSLLEAAANLGDGAWQRFRRVTLPLSMPGVIAAALLVFIPTVGDYFTPLIVGGTSGTMIGNVVQSLFTRTNNAPLGAAVSIVTMLFVGVLVLTFLASTGTIRRMRQAKADVAQTA
jgi:spermidine/putrescine transport system permease protein